MEIEVELGIEAGDWPNQPELRALVEAALAAVLAVLAPSSGRPAPRRELSVVLTDDDHVRRLNRDFRGQDKPTNVLSFPQGARPLLGDIVLAYETIAEEAALAGKPLKDHMAHLIIHGLLHLLGYDHETEGEAEAMEEVEREALERMGIADPYALPPG